MPLICPNCGAEDRSLQTKKFGAVMAHYRIGSVLTGGPLLTGILKESLWCPACCKAGKPSDSPVYVVVWPVAPGETAEHRRASQRLFDLPEEILTAPDPLAAILAANRRADEEAED